MNRDGPPFYVPVGSEVQVFRGHVPTGPLGHVERPDRVRQDSVRRSMAHDLGRPLITVACHDDLTTADLVGQFLRGGPSGSTARSRVRSKKVPSATWTRSSRPDRTPRSCSTHWRTIAVSSLWSGSV